MGRLVATMWLVGACAALVPGAGAAPAVLPQQSGTVDLLTQANVRIDGAGVDHRAGIVADAGDVNDDGIGDLVVGAPGATENGFLSGVGVRRVRTGRAVERRPGRARERRISDRRPAGATARPGVGRRRRRERRRAGGRARRRARRELRRPRRARRSSSSARRRPPPVDLGGARRTAASGSTARPPTSAGHAVSGARAT